MTNLLEPWSDHSFSLIIIAILCIAVIAAAAHIIKKNREKKHMLQEKYKTGNFSYQPHKYRPEKKLIQRMIPALQSRSPKIPVPVSEENSILHKKTDITQNLLLLTRKYSLDLCTIATSDGLVVATSGGEHAQTDAATYGKMHAPDQNPIIPGVMIFELNLKGSALVGIIRTKNPVSEDISRKIAEDIQVMLNLWI